MNNIAVFLAASLPGSSGILELTQSLGTAIGQHNKTLIYGGSKYGLMGALANNVLQHGGQAIGILPECLSEKERPLETLTRLIKVDTMAERKRQLFELGELFIVLPGGIGTLEECIEIICQIKIGITQKPVIIVNYQGFFDPLLQLFTNMDDQGFLPKHFFYCFKVVNNKQALMKTLSSCLNNNNRFPIEI